MKGGPSLGLLLSPEADDASGDGDLRMEALRARARRLLSAIEAKDIDAIAEALDDGAADMEPEGDDDFEED